MPVKAVKAPGLDFVPTAQPSPCSRRTSRVVGTPHTHEAVGFDDEVHGGMWEDLLLEGLTAAEVPADDPVSVDDALKLRRRGETFEMK